MSKKKRDPSAVARVCTDPETGLSTAQVQERINAGMANTPVKPPSKSVGQVIAENLFTYFNLIFTVLSVLLIMAGSYKDLTFLPLIIVNTLIGIVQELRSKALLLSSS